MFELRIMTTESVLEEIFSLYEEYGADDYIGEPISQIEHACQCADLAERDGNDEEVILAAFFHDFGHICSNHEDDDNREGYGNIRHEKLGADFLGQRGFSEKITRLIENHVQAKRYLCAKKPEYYRKLSEASKKTLEYQGGPMSADEVVTFEKDPMFQLSIKLRVWDEAAKEENIPLPDLNIYREMAGRHLRKE